MTEEERKALDEQLEQQSRKPVIQAPQLQAGDPSTWNIRDTATGAVIKDEPTQAVSGYKLPPRPTIPAGYGDYGWFDDFASQYFEKPLTPEERARRERAAYISAGVTNLGNALGASPLPEPPPPRNSLPPPTQTRGSVPSANAPTRFVRTT